MKVERTCIEKTREFPEWLKRAIEQERAELPNITDPVRRRMAEIEINEIESRVRTELAGSQ